MSLSADFQLIREIIREYILIISLLEKLGGVNSVSER